MIHLHRLALLRELAARETITAVAEALAYTPSAVSQQLSTLEREIGVRLMERRGRRVVLTAAGLALAERADGVLAAAEDAASAAVAASGEVHGPVAIGAVPSVGATIVPRAVASVTESHPLLELHYLQHGDAGLRELELGHLDIWIDQRYSVLPWPDAEDLDERVLLIEPVCLAVRRDADRGAQMSAYRDQIWVGGTRAASCGRLLYQLCADAGFEPDLRYVTEDLEVTLGFVTAGAAVAVLPRLATARVPDDVVVHPIAGAMRQVVALNRRVTSDRPAISLVLDRLQEAGEATSVVLPAA